MRRPHVLVNMAMSADGKIDTIERRGARISGAADTARVDRLRAASDAVMVGGHTLLWEDPRLTVRDAQLIAERVHGARPPQPTKIGVVTRVGAPGTSSPASGETAPGGAATALPSPSRFLEDGGGPVIVATTGATTQAARAWLAAQGADLIVHDTSRVDLVRLLGELRGRGIERLMVEGGGTLVAALVELGLVDELQLAVAPVLLGGTNAPTPVAGQGWTVSRSIRLSLLSAEADHDGDVILRYGVLRGR